MDLVGGFQVLISSIDMNNECRMFINFVRITKEGERQKRH